MTEQSGMPLTLGKVCSNDTKQMPEPHFERVRAFIEAQQRV